MLQLLNRAGGPAWRRDLPASVVLFLISVPLSLGLALATGAPPQAGLVATIVGGIVAGLLGGVPLQVSGAATGLVVVTTDLVQRYGWRATCAITVLAGLTQLALGALRVARTALAVSPAIVHGMLAGIGVVIAIGQLQVLLDRRPDTSALGNLTSLPDALPNLRPAALLIAAVTVAVLLLWPRLPGRAGRALRTVPAPLAAVAVATAASTGMSLPRVDLPAWRLQALPGLPDGPVLGLIAAVLTVTLVASMESLLSAVAVDRLRATRPGAGPAPAARLDRELAGQGAANIVSGLLGGMAVAGGAIRGSANVGAGAVSRRSTVLHGCWVLVGAVLLVGPLELMPLASLAALVMMVGAKMVSFAHIKHVQRHREFPVYVATLGGVILIGVLQGVLVGIAVAGIVALRRLTHTRITVLGDPEHHLVRVDGQLTFLAVPRLTRALAQVPAGCHAVVELGGSFMDHAAYDALQGWAAAHRAQGGRVTLNGRSGHAIAEPARSHACHPWTPWRNHHCTRPAVTASEGADQLLGGVSAFQRDTAPLVREELARLAREGQRPTQLFLTCADSRLVTSMITSSGPGDLFTVRNVGNLMPPPGSDVSCDSVGAAVEYAVEMLEVDSITVCGHSGCGAMQALLSSPSGPGAPTPLARWLRHGRPSLTRMEAARMTGHPEVVLADRPVADDTERLALVNVMQQLDHLMAHPCVARRVAAGTLTLRGMYFHVGEAQAYVLDAATGTFRAVRPEVAPSLDTVRP
ncbi:bifunctional SulP family inorganic anion transporter/carbonic anhydrase [Streptomyces pactum]|uniref:Bifunctional SulP family inorganic anion transporter/carbonic anhydrase n=1 Tax=Streptomyces pactum TaxID=68249 RepID=A0ABS0NKP0_9ACTN|nr:SulP family inorganic anion transporter [Streptomyces pactum]MBH5335774.1 bifunctional SulP family inorganic anion transporter/carbonic anhydrase [Streptomyces pactum]